MKIAIDGLEKGKRDQIKINNFELSCPGFLVSFNPCLVKDRKKRNKKM